MSGSFNFVHRIEHIPDILWVHVPYSILGAVSIASFLVVTLSAIYISVMSILGYIIWEMVVLDNVRLGKAERELSRNLLSYEYFMKSILVEHRHCRTLDVSLNKVSISIVNNRGH